MQNNLGSRMCLKQSDSCMIRNCTVRSSLPVWTQRDIGAENKGKKLEPFIVSWIIVDCTERYEDSIALLALGNRVGNLYKCSSLL